MNEHIKNAQNLLKDFANRKRVRAIFNSFVQNTKAMRKRAKRALKGE